MSTDADAVRDAVALVTAVLAGDNAEQMAQDLAHAAEDPAHWAGVVGAGVARMYASTILERADGDIEAARALWATSVGLGGPDSDTDAARHLREPQAGA